MAWTPPASAKNIPIRPLTAGVQRGIPPEQVPNGGFLTIQNALVTERGLRRRPGYVRLGIEDPIPYLMHDLALVWNSLGTQDIGVITEKTLFAYSLVLGATEVPWAYSTGSISVSGSTVTGTGTAWTTNDILPGDLLRAGGFEAEVDAIADADTMSIKNSNIPDDTYATYSIQRAFGPTDLAGYGFTIFNGRLIIADSKRPLITWNEPTDTLEYWTTDTANMLPGNVPFVPKVVRAFMDRIWVANTYDATDGYQRQRIRWSNLADTTDFSTATSYIDIPYLGGEILDMAPLGNRLIVYFQDGIYAGIPTSFPLLPLRFDRIETGGIGLVSNKAVAVWQGVHFFCGQDNIYVIDQNGIQPIGTPMIADVLARCSNPTEIRAFTDPDNSQVIFGFPIDSVDQVNELWYFNTHTKAWSSGLVNTHMMSGGLLRSYNAWDALTGTWDALGATYPTWDSFRNDGTVTSFIIESGGLLWKSVADAHEDFGGSPIVVTLETPDIDFGAPDELKTITRFNMRLNHGAHPMLTETLTFGLEGSTNHGTTWRDLGNLVFPAGDLESSVTFRISGSSIRFRITSENATHAYLVSEMGVRVRGGGSELSYGTQNG